MVAIPRLRAVRERAMLTQAELSERSGVTEATISRIESGHQDARISTARKLAEALSVEPSILMGEGEPVKGAE